MTLQQHHATYILSAVDDRGRKSTRRIDIHAPFGADPAQLEAWTVEFLRAHPEAKLVGKTWTLE